MGLPPPLPPISYKVSSSPSRTEKLPTPGLARLLRGNGGSRSRGRNSLSRSSPLFTSGSQRIARTAGTLDAGDEGEPSSPKVTCIGQVRIRKKSKSVAIRSDFKGNRTIPDKEQRRGREMRCCFIKKVLFRRSSVAAGFQSVWRRCAVRLCFEGTEGYRMEKEKIEPDEADPLPIRDPRERGRAICFNKAERKDDVETECDESEIRVFVPPKNALVLMRCRSAPHKHPSAFPEHFFPVTVAGNGEESEKGEDESGKEPQSYGSGSGNEREKEEEHTAKPFFLKRCKSEPATKAARLPVPEQNTVDGCRWSAEGQSRVLFAEASSK